MTQRYHWYEILGLWLLTDEHPVACHLLLCHRIQLPDYLFTDWDVLDFIRKYLWQMGSILIVMNLHIFQGLYRACISDFLYLCLMFCLIQIHWLWWPQYLDHILIHFFQYRFSFYLFTQFSDIFLNLNITNLLRTSRWCWSHFNEQNIIISEKHTKLYCLHSINNFETFSRFQCLIFYDFKEIFTMLTNKNYDFQSNYPDRSFFMSFSGGGVQQLGNEA